MSNVNCWPGVLLLVFAHNDLDFLSSWQAKQKKSWSKLQAAGKMALKPQVSKAVLIDGILSTCGVCQEAVVSLTLRHHILDDFIFWRWHQFDENHMRQAGSQFRMDLLLIKGWVDYFHEVFGFQRPCFCSTKRCASHRNQFHSLFANHRQYKAPVNLGPSSCCVRDFPPVLVFSIFARLS